jgi:hypothetical protein
MEEKITRDDASVNRPADAARREFLQKAGKFAAYTPPTMLALMYPGTHAIASGGGSGVGVDPVIIGVDPNPVPVNKDECKRGGWENLYHDDGTAFKNQGDCIQYVKTGK